MLSKKLQAALNNQIAEEDFASHYYLSMASWCDKSGLHGSSKFLYQQSESEKAHMMKLFHYVNDTGSHAVVRQVKEAPQEFKNITDIFELMLEHERAVTKLIHALGALCQEEQDHSTYNFLQWYFAEQHEEERVLIYILDLIKITGVEGRGVFLIDREIGKITATGLAAEKGA